MKSGFDGSQEGTALVLLAVVVESVALSWWWKTMLTVVPLAMALAPLHRATTANKVWRGFIVPNLMASIVVPDREEGGILSVSSGGSA